MLWKAFSLSFVGIFTRKAASFAKRTSVMSNFAAENPFLRPWSTPFKVPPFAEISHEHFEPAFEVAFKKHVEDIATIVANQEPPTFENTISALDRAGGLLTRLEAVFQNLCSSCSSKELQAVEMKMAAPLAAHASSIYTYPGLFQKIDVVYSSRQDANLTIEQLRLVERFHLDFTRAGAKFSEEAQVRYTEIMKTLAELTTKFTQNVVADEGEITVDLIEEDLSGLPNFLKQAAKQAAIERSKPEYFVITLSRSLVVPFLTFSDRRDLRERVWRLWTSRGELDAGRDNIAIAKQILILRSEQARMHGYKTFADYATADTMAGSPAAVSELLERVWAPAKVSADRERQALESFLREDLRGEVDEGFQIQPWDWRYVAEKVRSKRYDLDENELKPYFPLDRMIQAIFDCANKLFGLTFVKRPDIVAYHPDVDVYEVRRQGENGQDDLLAIFLHDNYSRQYKASGAWMSEYRCQSKNKSMLTFGKDCSTDESDLVSENSVPIIVNNNNFARGSDSEPTLLSFDDAKTLFHEFGHGLHGMLSDVTYNRLAGTSVLRDFVELPSQLYEHWLSQPVVLKKHARHYKTNEPIPDELLQKLMAARAFNQGFDTVEYTACALIDQMLHQIPSESLADFDMKAFEVSELQRLGMPDGIVLRHRPSHFQHLFSGSSYASAYYVYLWAEVLDADGFDAFLETGNPFDPATAMKVKRFVYSSGNSIDPREAFRSFRGRDPKVEPMLRKKGLLSSTGV